MSDSMYLLTNAIIILVSWPIFAILICRYGKASIGDDEMLIISVLVGAIMAVAWPFSFIGIAVMYLVKRFA